MLIDSNTNEDNKRKTRAHLPVEQTFGFQKTLKETKGLGFELQVKTPTEKQPISMEEMMLM